MTYQLAQNQQLLRHFPTDSYLLHDHVAIPHQEVVVKVKSGQYFASLAMTLENLSDDPYIQLDTLKYIMRKFAEELLYMQDAYIIKNR